MRARPRWPLLLSLLLGVVALVALFGYSNTRPSGEEVPRHGGTYVEGVAGRPLQVNPLFAAFNDVDRDLSALVFAGLVRLDGSGNVQADLAERWTVTPDGLIYAFELRPGLVWHDGDALEASDVVFTIETVQDPAFDGDPNLKSVFEGVSVEALDSRTVIFELSQPFAPFLSHLTVGILPEHLLEDVSVAGMGDTAFNQQPVGAGPYRLLELVEDHASLDAFEAYHLEAPYIEHVELRFQRDDAALYSALTSRAIDGALFRPGLGIDQIAAIDDDGTLVRRTLHGTSYTLVYLNQRSGVFRDDAVRRALQLGLDRNALIQQTLAGQSLALDSPLASGLWAYSPDANAYRFDAPAANALLDDAGWALDGDVRANDGDELRFTLATSDDPEQVAVAEELARQWTELGAQAEVQVHSPTQFVNGVLLAREFDAALVTIEPGPDPDLYPIWHSSQVLGEGRNLSSYSNLDVDRLLEEARLSTSTAQRAALYRSFQALFAETAPAVLLYTPAYQYVVDERVRGLSPGLLFDLSSRFTDIHRWYVETGEPEDDA
jgi:peptide/nickel transport system substrate-binding protein